MAIWAFVNGCDCSNCPESFRKVRGCYNKLPSPLIIEGIELWHCPAKSITPYISEYINAYYFFKNGFLPNTGGWLEQPLKFNEVIVLIDRYFKKFSEKENV